MHNNLPNLNFYGDILFTTRLKAIAHSLVTVSPAICIRELSVDDCVELLLTAANITTNKEASRHEAKDFVKKVGCLPLAVEQAGAYVSELGGGIEVLGEGLDDLDYSEVLEWDNRALKYEVRSISSLFTTILKEVDSESAESGRLLRLLCFLDTKNISLDALADAARSLMERIKEKELPNSDAIESAEANRSVAHRIRAKIGPSRPSGSNAITESGFHPYRITDECRSLCLQLIQPKTRNQMAEVLKNFSLASRIKASLTIHDLTRDVILQHTRTETSPDILSLGVQLISEALLAVADPASPTLWPHFKSLVPHLQCLASHAKLPEHLNKQLCDAAHNAGLYLGKSGLYTGAEELHKRALAGKEKGFRRDHPSTRTTTNGLAVLYKSLGKNDDAEEQYKRALAGNEKALGRDHSFTLNTVHSLAGLYKLQAKYDDAKELYKRALAGYEKTLGHDHPSTLTTINDLAALYKSQGNYDNAEELYKRALAGREKALGCDHPSTLATAHNLAALYESHGKYENAEELYKRALAGKEKALGGGHPSTLRAVHDLAGLYKSKGKYDNAEELYKRALAGRENALGRDHPDTIKTVSNLAALYESQGKDNNAKELRNHSLVGSEKILECFHHA